MNFDRILQIAFAFQPANALFTAHRLGVFRILSEKPLSFQELAERCGIRPRAAIALADALTGLGLLRKKEGRYSNAEDTEYFLVPGKDSYLGGLIDYQLGSSSKAWGQAIDSMRTSQPVGGMTAWDYMYGDFESCAALGPVRYALSFLFGDEIARHAKLEGCSHLLVVADAGRNVFNVLKLYPNLRATIVDGPANMPYFKENIAKYNLEDRVTLLPCNFMEAEFPKGCDAALIPEIIQNWDDETLIKIFRRARDVLPPKAPCVVSEFWLNEDKTGPIGGCMHNLQMVLRSEAGYHRSDSEIRSLLERSGFENVEIVPPFGSMGTPMAVYRATVPA